MAYIKIDNLNNYFDRKIARATRAIKKAAFEEAINRTPVASGKMMDAWQILEGNQRPKKRGNKGTAEQKIAEIRAAVDGADAASVHRLVNTVHYAFPVNSRENIIEGAISLAKHQARRIVENAGEN